MYHITMKDQNTPEQTEFDFNESGETEQQRLEREVLAAGGNVGMKEGRFAFGIEISKGCSRGDEHPDISGLFFWSRNNRAGNSIWLNASCIKVDKDKLRKRNEIWAKENPDGVAKKNKRWRERNRDYRQRYREENRERIAEVGRIYREENKEKEIERHKRYREENPEKIREQNKRYRECNRDKERAKYARRRARKLEALDPSASKAIIESRYATEEYLNTVTGYKWHVDHTQPISRGGKDHEDNLQVVPAKWNQSKGASHCDRWIEDSDIYRYATAVEARFEREAKKNEKK